MKWSELSSAERNRLVAEHVIGNFDPVCKGPLRRTGGDAHASKYYCRECLLDITVTTEYFAQQGLPESHTRNCPAYSTDMNAAWKVLQEFESRSLLGQIEIFFREVATSYDAYSDDYASNQAIFSLEDLAKLTSDKICFAILEAIGIDIEP